MKKYILVLMSALILSSGINNAFAKSGTDTSLASAIKMYKAGNYSQSYQVFSNIVKRDPSNAVAYYYLAMTQAQIGLKDEALESYAKVLTLSPNGKLGRYAQKGKTCIETPDKCGDTDEATELDTFVQRTFGSGFSEEARSKYEKNKIENLMREMNRKNDLTPAKFKEYKDFSSMNNDGTPTNDEIVAAIRVLQNAGIYNILGNNNLSSISLLNDIQGGNYRSEDILNMMGNGTSINPMLIKSLLTNQAGF